MEPSIAFLIEEINESDLASKLKLLSRLEKATQSERDKILLSFMVARNNLWLHSLVK